MPQAEQAVLRYLNYYEARHRANEEHNLIPTMQSAAKGKGAIRAYLPLPGIMNEHRHRNTG